MGIRTTSSDPTDFIYDSVSGYAIGPNWTDAQDMEDFLEWWTNNHQVDLRRLSNPEVEEAIKLWHDTMAAEAIVQMTQVNTETE
jgi:hypothetical protein